MGETARALPALVGTLVLSVALTVSCTTSKAGGNDQSISEARRELLAQVIDIPGSDGHRYQAVDDMGHTMDTAKIIQINETGEFAAVYHWWDDATQHFTPSLATSDNLLDWQWRVDLAHGTSMPTIAPASDSGYVIAWEDDADPRVIPVAAGVFAFAGLTLPPAAAAVAMSFSTIIVAANAQLLRRLDLRPEPLSGAGD